ncbi:glial maturation factor [Aspergillus arachidicola]|uniref:Glial maturation factor n=1 Tax=Aspergillus arachidicola TaxID=656916 RepID=A0A2G7G0U0_9EURO|nr:glial maturation factor [Aspergillus arachidicola]
MVRLPRIPPRKRCAPDDISGEQASESRLYAFSPETKEKLRKFRLGTSRAKDPQAIIYIIDQKNQEIRPEDGEVYTKMEDLADELPDSSPRFILLSYPLTLKSGRPSVPYVLLYWLPENCNPNSRMMYAGAVELMRNTAQVNRVIEVEEEKDIISIESNLQGED